MTVDGFNTIITCFNSCPTKSFYVANNPVLGFSVEISFAVAEDLRSLSLPFVAYYVICAINDGFSWSDYSEMVLIATVLV